MAAITDHLRVARQDTYTGDPSVDGNIAGAQGSSNSGVVLSRGALVAIIVVVVVVALFGIATTALFFIAKKREWTVKETLRRSARKVVTALTPRRTEFPRSVKEAGPGGRAARKGRRTSSRLDDVPPTPRIKPGYLDLEKGLPGSKDNKKGDDGVPKSMWEKVGRK